MKSFASRVLDLALCLFAAALLMVAAWSLLRPLLPVIVAVALSLGIISLTVRWRRFW